MPDRDEVVETTEGPWNEQLAKAYEELPQMLTLKILVPTMVKLSMNYVDGLTESFPNLATTETLS